MGIAQRPIGKKKNSDHGRKISKIINKNITRYEDTYVSRKRSAKELRLMCSCFIATSVKIIWSGCTPCATASNQKPKKMRLGKFPIKPNSKHCSTLQESQIEHLQLNFYSQWINYSRARSLASPAAGNLRSQSALFGTRFKILHLPKWSCE